MVVLGIETSSTTGGVALLRDNKTIAQRAFEKGLVHGRELAPSIRSAAEEAGLELKEIDLVAVDAGPGSYTGVRVGVATAKALAWALGAKLVSVVSLDALAEAAKDLGPSLVTALDARRGHLYTAAYETAGGEVSRVDGPEIAPLEGFLDRLPRPAVLLGDGIKKLPENAGEEPGITYAPREFWIPRAQVVASLGLRAAGRGEFADVLTLEPLYLRRSEAEEKFGVKVDPASAEPEHRH